MNDNQIAVYSGSTAVNDPFGLLRRAEQITFSTTYPGGYYDTFNCFIPCDPMTPLPFTYMNYLSVRNGLTVIWYGWITAITLVIGKDRSGVEVSAVGQLAYFKYTSGVRRWIDRRFSSEMAGVWEYQVGASYQSEKCTPDQYNRLMFTPKAEAWVNGNYVVMKYRTYNNARVKRISFSYDFQEGAQAWECDLYDVTNAAVLWNVTASGTGTQDIAMATSSAELEFRYIARANQTPTADGAIYAKITDLAVYGVNPSDATISTVTGIIKGYCALMGYTDYTYIGTNSYSLSSVGFVADDLSETFLDTIQRVMQFSNTNDSYSFGFNDLGLPYFETFPALTDYDYVVNFTEAGLDSVELVLSADFGEVYNDVFVRRSDEDGKRHIVTSIDDASLGDTASKDKYWQRIYRVDAGTSSQAGAIDVGKQALKSKKDLQYYVRQPLTLRGTIRKKDGTRVPVSHVRAGKRIKIENFSTDAGDVLDAGLTFLISRTEYNDDDNSISISCGLPDDLAIYLARREVMDNRQL